MDDLKDIKKKLSNIINSIDHPAQQNKLQQDIIVVNSDKPPSNLVKKFGPKLAKQLVPIIELFVKYPKAREILQELFNKMKSKRSR